MMRLELNLTRNDLVEIFFTYIQSCYALKINRETIQLDLPHYLTLNFIHTNPDHPSGPDSNTKQYMTLTAEDHLIQ
jgi:hypothetical protein